jgi:hypothetical protein
MRSVPDASSIAKVPWLPSHIRNCRAAYEDLANSEGGSADSIFYLSGLFCYSHEVASSNTMLRIAHGFWK